MTKRILIIEDEQDIAEGLKVSLEQEGFDADICLEGEKGVQVTDQHNYDLIICDIMMPNMNGFEVIAEIRRKNDLIPIIILSARIEDKDKIRALNLGADDYVTKPFNLDELIARVKRKANMSSKISLDAQICFGHWTFNKKTRQLFDTSIKKYIDVASNDLDVLELLLSRQNELIPREEIIRNIWGEEHSGSQRIVDNCILRLRKIFGKTIIKTIRGKGYRLISK